MQIVENSWNLPLPYSSQQGLTPRLEGNDKVKESESVKYDLH